MYKVIGIAGPARSGKDTAADIIINKCPAWQKTSFADPIKAMLRVGLGLTESQLYGSEKDEYDPYYKRTPRHMLQTLGTEWGRDCISKNVWVDAMHKHLSKLGGTFIIPDVRFESEADFIRKYGILVHVTDRGDIIDSKHSSENPIKIDSADILLRNNRSVAEYHENIALILTEIMKRL